MSNSPFSVRQVVRPRRRVRAGHGVEDGELPDQPARPPVTDRRMHTRSSSLVGHLSASPFCRSSGRVRAGSGRAAGPGHVRTTWKGANSSFPARELADAQEQAPHHIRHPKTSFVTSKPRSKRAQHPRERGAEIITPCSPVLYVDELMEALQELTIVGGRVAFAEVPFRHSQPEPLFQVFRRRHIGTCTAAGATWRRDNRLISPA